MIAQSAHFSPSIETGASAGSASFVRLEVADDVRRLGLSLGGGFEAHGVEVGEAGLAVVVDADRQGIGQLAVDLLLRVDDAVVEDVGQRGAQNLRPASRRAPRPACRRYREKRLSWTWIASQNGSYFASSSGLSMIR